ncbi:Protein of unknown function [Bacillus cytotoxicus]|uniref:Uncharacterized protein n=1 Tax=Bacillus cytotoxicus TaxID=580165 RepID=A0AAX2CFP0_9BACI|nr:Protein of unknown function [Bacillus cytotoxicus]
MEIEQSKMGEVPDGPVSFEYPIYKGELLQFIAQFHLYSARISPTSIV